MLNKTTRPTSSTNKVGFDSACLVDNKSHDWIIDTGAINHMVLDPSLLSKGEEVKPSNSKKVYLPNADVANVTHIGTSPLSSMEYN